MVQYCSSSIVLFSFFITLLRSNVYPLNIKYLFELLRCHAPIHSPSTLLILRIHYSLLPCVLKLPVRLLPSKKAEKRALQPTSALSLDRLSPGIAYKSTLSNICFMLCVLLLFPLPPLLQDHYQNHLLYFYPWECLYVSSGSG